MGWDVNVHVTLLAHDDDDDEDDDDDDDYGDYDYGETCKFCDAISSWN